VEQKATNGLFATLSKLNFQEENKMSTIPVNDDQILRELQTESAKWIMKTFPTRLNNGVDEIEVRLQLKAEAEQWVQENFELRRQGKEGTPLPA
jgi:hypothetical protein